MTRSKSAAAVAVGLTIASTAAVGTGAASVFAADADALGSSCALHANMPWGGYGDPTRSVFGEGGRSGCGSTRRVTVLLREDRRWWPDRTLSEKEATGANVDLVVRAACDGFFPERKLYVETRTNTGGKVQSPRAVLLCG